MTHPQKISLAALNQCGKPQFIDFLGGVFEHSPWVAEQVALQRPFDSLDALHQAMVDVVHRADADAQLRLIRAHPELAGKAAIRGRLTHHSSKEQAGAGLDQCSPEQYRELTELNQRYNQKFGFPFILAVRGYDRDAIIQQFRRRLQLDPHAEQAESLRQIYRIARFRLDDLIQE